MRIDPLVDEAVGSAEVQPRPRPPALHGEDDLAAGGVALLDRGVEVGHQEPGHGVGEMPVVLAGRPEDLDRRAARDVGAR